MITFDNIEKFSKRYHCYNYFLRFFHDHLYYRKYYVINKENVPPKGEPVMVIANHQNGLMDALAILYLFEDDRQPVFIARGDIFKKDWIAKILRFLKILPTFRNRDGGVGDIKRNNITFEHAARILRKGGTLVMFPEAGHQAGHFMSTFKKGFPRIAFAAEEENDFKLGLKILPLNIHYSDYFNCRSKLMVTVGKPFTFQEFFEQYTTDPNLAYLALNEKARAAVKALTPDIEFPEYYPEMELLRQMLCKPRLKAKGIDPDYFPNQKPEEVILIQELTEMKENDSENFLRLMNITKEYRQGLEQYNLRDWLINKKITFWKLLLATVGFVIAFPLFLFGWIHNILPFEFSAIFRKKIKDRMLHSSVNFVGGFVAFTLVYILIFTIAWWLSKSVLFALAYLVAVFISFYIFYQYKRGFIKLKAAWRYYNLKRKGILHRIGELKQEIMKGW